jgi:hypothetical protein
MKNKILVLSSIAISLMLAGCNNSVISSNKQSEQSEQNDNDKFVDELSTTDDVYGYSALSSTMLLSQLSTANSAALAMSGPKQVSEEDVEKINGYLNLFEGLLNDDGLLSSVVTKSDKEGYEYKLTISIKNLLQEVETYVMYYNETIITEVEIDNGEPTNPESDTSVDSTISSSETISSDDSLIVDENATLEDFIEKIENKFKEVRPFDRQYDSFNEVSTKIDGIMIIDDVEYAIVGGKILVEVDGHKSVRTNFISKIDNKNYVRVIQKEVDNKQRFEYRVVKDGKVASKSEVQIKKNETKTQIELVLYENDAFTRYTFKKVTEEDVDIIFINIIENFNTTSIKVFIRVDETTGETSYVYFLKEGLKINKARKRIIVDKEVVKRYKEYGEKVRDYLENFFSKEETILDWWKNIDVTSSLPSSSR